MRMMIKKLLKKHKYPPEGMDDEVKNVMTQCELWTDNNHMRQEEDGKYLNTNIDYLKNNGSFMMVAESEIEYGQK